MYYFRAFELNIKAMPLRYSMLYTGNFVFDNEVRNGLISLGTESENDYTLVYYDNTCDANGVAPAEEVAEQDNGNMWWKMYDVKNRHHSTRAQLMAFKAAIHYSHYGCFFPPYPVEGEYTPDFNTFEK